MKEGMRRRQRLAQRTGHADRLGATAYNQRLSQARAHTVLQYLQGPGRVQAKRVSAQGRGEAEPKVQCDQKERQALIQCLAPNRRVSISVLALEAKN